MSGRSTYDSCRPNIASRNRPVASVDSTSESDSSGISHEECYTSSPLSTSESELLWYQV